MRFFLHCKGKGQILSTKFRSVQRGLMGRTWSDTQRKVDSMWMSDPKDYAIIVIWSIAAPNGFFLVNGLPQKHFNESDLNYTTMFKRPKWNAHLEQLSLDESSCQPQFCSSMQFACTFEKLFRSRKAFKANIRTLTLALMSNRLKYDKK